MTKKREVSIQRVELSSGQAFALHCPFSGARAVDSDSDRSWFTGPCPHTLFAAHDLGFEYRSEAFDDALGIDGVDDEDIDLGEAGYDGLTDAVCIPGAVKFAWYESPPGEMGCYVGFAPLVDD